VSTGQLARAPVAPPRPPDLTGGPGALAPHRLTIRLVRRSSLLMMLAAAAYMGTEILSYRAAYPNEASRDQIARLSDSLAVRALQGVPEALNTAAGFSVWDAGWLLSLIVGTWALMTATRLMRGEEDSLRAELVLCRPVSARRVATAQLAVLGLALLGIGLATALSFIALGEPVEGALLFGLGLGSFGAVFASVGALAAQVLDPRRRAVTLAAGAMLLSFVVRTFANSADERMWLLRLTPSGWLDGLDPFADDHWLGLTPSLATALVVSALAVLARGRRDTGAGLLHVRDAHPARLWLLGSATAYGWRATTGTLAAWAAGCAVTTAMLGTMVTSIADFIAEDPSYRKVLEQMGMDMSDPIDGYLRFMAIAMALAYAMFVCWRIGAVRTEEAEGRLDNLWSARWCGGAG
jgi:ABC-2 type transport system permease protein